MLKLQYVLSEKWDPLNYKKLKNVAFVILCYTLSQYFTTFLPCDPLNTQYVISAARGLPIKIITKDGV